MYPLGTMTQLFIECLHPSLIVNAVISLVYNKLACAHYFSESCVVLNCYVRNALSSLYNLYARCWRFDFYLYYTVFIVMVGVRSMRHARRHIRNSRSFPPPTRDMPPQAHCLIPGPCHCAVPPNKIAQFDDTEFVLLCG